MDAEALAPWGFRAPGVEDAEGRRRRGAREMIWLAVVPRSWGKIARGFAEKMGFTGSDGKPPCRWSPIRVAWPSAGAPSPG